MASKLTTSNRAGWGFALPGFGLIVLFIVIPFFFAFYLSLTNQRLISPNPTEFVGLSNYERLLSISVLTIAPETDDAGQVVRDDAGEAQYPRVRTFTRNNPEYPQYAGMREWFRWHWGETAKVVVATDVVFWKSLRNTLMFVLVVAPVQAGVGIVSCAAGEPETARHQRLPCNLFHARCGFHCRGVTPVSVYLRRKRRAVEQHAEFLVLRIVRGQGLAGQSRHGPRCDQSDVDLASGRVSHGDLVVGPANDLAHPVRGILNRGRIQMADLPLCHVAGAAQHGRIGVDRDYDAGVRTVCPD